MKIQSEALLSRKNWNLFSNWWIVAVCAIEQFRNNLCCSPVEVNLYVKLKTRVLFTIWKNIKTPQGWHSLIWLQSVLLRNRRRVNDAYLVQKIVNKSLQDQFATAAA